MLSAAKWEEHPKLARQSDAKIVRSFLVASLHFIFRCNFEIDLTAVGGWVGGWVDGWVGRYSLITEVSTVELSPERSRWFHVCFRGDDAWNAQSTLCKNLPLQLENLVKLILMKQTITFLVGDRNNTSFIRRACFPVREETIGSAWRNEVASRQNVVHAKLSPTAKWPTYRSNSRTHVIDYMSSGLYRTLHLKTPWPSCDITLKYVTFIALKVHTYHGPWTKIN